jgi:glucose 1-dehydrogenase
MILDRFRLDGQVAVVTGGGLGIGRGIAVGLAEAGADVVVAARTRSDLDEVVGLVQAAGRRGHAVVTDVMQAADRERLISEAVDVFGRLDVLVNNAGIETRTSVLDTTEDQYEKVLAINLKSAFFGTQLAAKQMIAQGGGGRIINMTSVHEDWPMPGNTPYCLSKGGMRMLTRTAGLELAPHGILVTGVGPGAVDTPINASTVSNPELLAKLNSSIPMGRLAEPNEIASVVAFLAGPGASYVTATTIFADGGIMQSSPGL